jgi:hypothetical protein
MDLEVRQAQRTLQRAGVEILTDAVSLEEFPFQYGNLLASWLKNMGLPGHVIRLPKVASQWDSAAEFLRTQVDAKARIHYYIHVRAAGFSGYPISAISSTDDQIMAEYLSYFSPLDIITLFQLIAADSAVKAGGKTQLIFFVSPTDARPAYGLVAVAAGRIATTSQECLSVSAYVYSYMIPTPEDIAKEAARIAKEEQKELATAEKRRKAKEAKEKALLKKLQEKYSESESDRAGLPDGS